LLRAHQDSLAQIALKCGFCDQSHFSRVFHKFKGMAPKAWQSVYAEEPSCLESFVLASNHKENEDRHGFVYRP
jgi:AraC-like DNA-binding protein